MRNAKAVAAVLLIFLLGAASGGLVAHLIYQKRIEGVVRGGPGPTTEMILHRMDRQLKLDRAQREAIRSIVQETHREMRRLRRQLHPQMRQILETSEARITALLRPDQQEAFKQIKRHREETGEGPPGSPGPHGPP